MRATTSPFTALLLAAAVVAAATGCSTPSPSGPGDGGNPPPPPAGYHFTYSPPPQAPVFGSLSVRGSFNDWGETPMVKGTNGVWQAFVDLPDGTYQYKFYVDGAWIGDMCYDETWGDPDNGYVVDPDADGCTPDGYEGANAVITLGAVPLDFRHDTGDPAYLSEAGGRLSVRFRARAGRVTSALASAGGSSYPMQLQLVDGVDELWRVSLPSSASSYAFDVVTPDSSARFGPYHVPGNLFRSVGWAEDGVAYQIFPERFWNGDTSNDHWTLDTDEIHFLDPSITPQDTFFTQQWDGPVTSSLCCHQYFGGDLQGILDRLPHLDSLGVDALYLNPIFLAGSAHGYDTYDYFQVAPNFGDSTVLRSLLEAAHARGIHVIWDFVPNHVGIGHWAFQDAIQNGQASDYRDWFTFKVPADSVQAGDGNDYAAWWGFGSLPELRTENPYVMDHLLAVTRRWMSFGFDGIRVDVPGDIQNRSSFFPAWRAAAKAIDPDAYLVGEIWEQDPSWLRGDQFDALMNYALGQGMVEAFAAGDIGGVVAARRLASMVAAYPEAATAMMFNIIASHDTDRLLTMLGGGELDASPGPTSLARQRLATALLYALPGMPVTFQGDECAQLGGAGGSHTARYPVQWSRCDVAMVDHYVQLAQLKHGLAALGSPVVRAGEASPTVLTFYRGEPGPGEVLAVFNNGTADATVALPAGSWSDAVTRESLSGSASVDALGWRYLVHGG